MNQRNPIKKKKQRRLGIAWYITFGRHILHANRKSKSKTFNMNSSGLGARLGYYYASDETLFNTAQK